MERKTWDEFRKNGLLWFINTILHAFGWAIVLEIDNGKVTDSYPARTSCRGFSEKDTEAGYIKLSEYMAQNADKLLKEAKGE